MAVITMHIIMLLTVQYFRIVTVAMSVPYTRSYEYDYYLWKVYKDKAGSDQRRRADPR